MYKLCLFAGTAEGRALAELLSGQAVETTVCVATAYGETLLPHGKGLDLRPGRQTQEEMEAMLGAENFDLVIDATHPYAPMVTENIAQACQATGTEWVRLVRDSAGLPEGAVVVPDAAAAAAYLDGVQGTILLTTGSKDLPVYGAIRDFSSRVYARVLPMEASLQACAQAGLEPSHILAMQGPFSQEMNEAMLRMTRAKYLVTKETGRAGGFLEKALAAQAEGATLVVVGRPPQREGLPFDQVVELLERRFGVVPRPQVTLVGIGPGEAESMTVKAQKALEEAQCLVGAERMLQAALRPGQTGFAAVAPGDIAARIRENPQFTRFAVVFSGDTGFYSGAKKLLPLLENCQVEILPGLSAMSYLCARLGTSYEDVTPVSLHGRSGDPAAAVQAHGRVFFLVGGENGAGVLCRRLTEAGLGGIPVAVGENLSYPQEKITRGTARELAEMIFSPLSAVLAEGEAVLPPRTVGLPDDCFCRCEAVPMTKSEVRAVCMSKLALPPAAVCWDVGAGTGSVTVEMARQAWRGQVYALERKEEAVALLKENCSRFALTNVHIVEGEAPTACENLPAPTHVFVGGAGRGLEGVLRLALEKNPSVRLVVTAISLETMGRLSVLRQQLPLKESSCVQLTVARDKTAGPYHLLMGQNPIFIMTMEGGGKLCSGH